MQTCFPCRFSLAVLDRTLSGGACWNDISIQTVQRGLPFGGVGESGCECIVLVVH